MGHNFSVLFYLFLFRKKDSNFASLSPHSLHKRVVSYSLSLSPLSHSSISSIGLSCFSGQRFIFKSAVRRRWTMSSATGTWLTKFQSFALGHMKDWISYIHFILNPLQPALFRVSFLQFFILIILNSLPIILCMLWLCLGFAFFNFGFLFLEILDLAL